MAEDQKRRDDLDRIEQAAKDTLAMADEALCDVMICGNFADLYDAAGAVSDMEVALRAIMRERNRLADRGKIVQFPFKEE